MDTRNKIIPADRLCELVGSGDWTVVSGRFDPMTNLQARRLAAFTGHKLAVVIEPGTDPILDAQSRAILVAALREVHAVTVSDRIPGDIEVVRDSAGETLRTEEFVKRVSR